MNYFQLIPESAHARFMRDFSPLMYKVRSEELKKEVFTAYISS